MSGKMRLNKESRLGPGFRGACHPARISRDPLAQSRLPGHHRIVARIERSEIREASRYGTAGLGPAFGSPSLRCYKTAGTEGSDSKS
jgi:hypothetical protein